jgi:nitroreductase
MKESLFFKRQSKRSYLPDKIASDVLNRLYERIRWSPSCANKQPWRFIFVTDNTAHGKLAGALAKGNEWATKAPVLIAVCARKSDDYTRDDDPITYYQFDCGLAVMSLLLGAVEEGLMAHPMAGYDAGKAKEALDIPDEYHVICLVSLGYQGPIELLDQVTRRKDEAPRTRLNVDEIIFHDRFGISKPSSPI